MLRQFHDWLGGSWAILFSHPDDYTPVCTTELSAVALSYADFASRGVKLIGLSANNVASHEGWIKDIDALNPNAPGLDFPIIGDEDRTVSELYGMLDKLDKTNVDKKGLPFTVRTVFISKYDRQCTVPYIALVVACRVADQYGWHSRPKETDPSHSRLSRLYRPQLPRNLAGH